MNPKEQFLTLQEIVTAARRKLEPGPWNYLTGATETETTMRRNRQALDSIAFRPRVLNDVSKVDSSATFLGKRVRLPVMLAPVGGMESFAQGAAADAARGQPMQLLTQSRAAQAAFVDLAGAAGTHRSPPYVRAGRR